MNTPFGQEELARLTREIWTEMLGIQVDADMNVPRSNRGSVMQAWIRISGGWEGVILLECSVNLARKAAANFFSSAEREVSCEQMKDAVGELANMTAGSLKPLVPGPIHMSLPSVVQENDCKLRIQEANLAAEMRFSSAGEALVVSVFRSNRGSKHSDTFSEQIN